MKSTKYRHSEKPDLQFTLGYPSESDKLRLHIGTVLQREVKERERRRLERERKREKELTSKSSRVTSSSDAMDTDEAGKHTTRVKSVSAESSSGEFYRCMISWVTSNIRELITKIKAPVPEVEHFI